MNTLVVATLAVVFVYSTCGVEGFSAGIGSSVGTGKREALNTFHDFIEKRIFKDEASEVKADTGMCNQLCDGSSFGCLRECKRVARMVKRVLDEKM